MDAISGCRATMRARKIYGLRAQHGVIRPRRVLPVVNAHLSASVEIGSKATTAPTTPGDFNPRSSCRERRWPRRTATCPRANFNPRSPCGERRRIRRGMRVLRDFNPRSPCGERRPAHGSRTTRTPGFQSALPLRGATSSSARFSSSRSRFQSALPLRGATSPASTAPTS